MVSHLVSAYLENLGNVGTQVIFALKLFTCQMCCTFVPKSKIKSSCNRLVSCVRLLDRKANP